MQNEAETVYRTADVGFYNKKGRLILYLIHIKFPTILNSAATLYVSITNRDTVVQLGYIPDTHRQTLLSKDAKLGKTIAGRWFIKLLKKVGFFVP